jgi:NAD(P)-dependent dehydrogenase (short-subunit alcohol dehydrogenase family)
VTRGGQAALPQETANPAQATLWGLSHVVAIEHPELRCRRVDLDAQCDATTAADALIRELRSTSDEDQIAVRRGGRFARRLVHYVANAERAALVPTRIDPARTYLVTGGLRGLGLRVAQWLVDEGARHLVLVGRQGPTPVTDAMIANLRSRDVRIVVVAGDVSVEADLQRVLDESKAVLPPLAGVIHAAGALDDGVLMAQSWERFATVMAAKVRGSWNIHRLAGEIDFLVLFSSGASIAGSAGQANYAAANAFEDALAWYRQSSGKPTVSINWGPWADIGAAADRKISGPGFLQPIAPDDGLRALAFAMRRDVTTGLFAPAQVAVLASDWTRAAADAATVNPVLADLVRRPRGAAPSKLGAGRGTPHSEPTWRQRLIATAPNRRRTLLRDQVRQLAAKVLGLSRADELNVDEPLRQLGLDSLMAVEFRNLLGVAAGQILPATITFDHPSVAALVEHLAATAFAVELAELRDVARAPTIAAPAASVFDTLSEAELAAQLLRRLDRNWTMERS